VNGARQFTLKQHKGEQASDFEQAGDFRAA
jgi:hypothetical protein